MKVLMLGWEFPPYFAGGVGVVCQHLTAALADRGHEITFLMPSGPERLEADHVQLLAASQFLPGLQTIRVRSRLVPYSPPPKGSAYDAKVLRRGDGRGTGPLYGSTLLEEVELFRRAALDVVEGLELEFDVIHAHDWTTFPAGAALKRATGKPLVAHVHITEFDKSGGEHADPVVYAIEKEGMAEADRVVAVSHRVARQCADRYQCDPGKIHVIHNAVDAMEFAAGRSGSDGKTVLFLGRVTMQKGPDYFVRAASKVLELRPNTTFILSGAGDMLAGMMELSAELGIGPRMVFTGFVDREQVAALHSRADVFVMPSVSEPFGIVPLEAMSAGVPTVVSRQSGVSEIIRHALKVNFWDVEELAAKIVAALSYPTLAGTLRDHGIAEAEALHWGNVAASMEQVYLEVAGD